MSEVITAESSFTFTPPPEAIVELHPEAPRPPPLPLPRSASELEALSPFLPWTEAEREAKDLPGEPEHERPSLWIDLMRAPGAVVERIVDPRRRTGVVVGSIAAIAVAQVVMATFAMDDFGAGRERLALAAPMAILSALLASLGPIYGVSVLMASRLPVARLVATILAAAASGSLALLALLPVPYLAMQHDPLWAGPLSLLGVLGASGLVSGVRIKRYLIGMAEEMNRIGLGRSDAQLSPSQRFRVEVLARMSMVVLAFVSMIAIWTLDRWM